MNKQIKIIIYLQKDMHFECLQRVNPIRSSPLSLQEKDEESLASHESD